MQYSEVVPAVFMSRPNRFVAHVLLQGKETVCHVKNTGRCRELLRPGARVYLEAARNPARKTKYDLIAVEKGTQLINMDSQAPNRVFLEFLRSGGFLPGITCIRPEYSYGDSRIDFYAEQGEKRHLIEVKGVTLEEDGVARFPDAPTLRGARHMEELARAAQDGNCSWVCFIIQMQNVKCFTPNLPADPKFCAALRGAANAGVQIRAYTCHVTPQELSIADSCPVTLKMQDTICKLHICGAISGVYFI